MKFVKVTRGYETVYVNADHIHLISEAEKNDENGSGKVWVTSIRFSLEPHDKIEVKERLEEVLKQLA
jgi:hypothetical protein